jgi:orotidine-5'-phosphate decarboxylase
MKRNLACGFIAIRLNRVMRNPILVALDVSTREIALDLARNLAPAVGGFKIGSELFTSAGPEIIEAIRATGAAVFLDLKFHDIPNTVAQACAAATRLGVWMINVHAAGGSAMLAAGRDAVANAAAAEGRARPWLIAVTLLTSIGSDDLAAIGVAGTADGQVLRLARLAQASGLDGVVCSAREAAMLRAACGANFKLVTPGIRPAGTTLHDQARVMTPAAAIAAGADYLVIGRAITAAGDPLRALQDITATLEAPA